MPAKAGIQTLAKNWVPAFAGTSGEGPMSDDDFLQRWSRRKQEAQAQPAAKPAALPAAKPAPKVAAKAEPEFDVTTLPPLESINALTDITAFLQKGVPAELARAALRPVGGWQALCLSEYGNAA